MENSKIILNKLTARTREETEEKAASYNVSGKGAA
jgi:hypothetical protein